MKKINIFFVLYATAYSFFTCCSYKPLHDFIVYENEIPCEELYQKNFTVNREKNNIESFIHQREGGEIFQSFFSPKDDILGILIGLIKAEEKSVKIATFFLTEQNIVDALIKAMERGVKVELVAGNFVVSGKYDECAKKLDTKGAKIFAYDPPKKNKWARGIMHNKFIIFEQNIYDKPLLITGSLNLTYSAHRYNKENIAIFNDSQMVKDYCEEFQYLKSCCWEYQQIKTLVPLKNDRIYQALFAPDNDIFRTLVGLIHEETESIKLAAFFLTESDVVDALAQAIARGVDVQIVADSKVVKGRYNYGAKELIKKGAKIFAYTPTEGIMHNKFLVFKNTAHKRPLLWTGSANFTGSARTYNKENASLFDDKMMIQSYDNEFEMIKETFCHPCKKEDFVRKRVKKRKAGVSGITNRKLKRKRRKIMPPC